MHTQCRLQSKSSSGALAESEQAQTNDCAIAISCNSDDSAFHLATRFRRGLHITLSK